jgi:hypothetical protein
MPSPGCAAAALVAASTAAILALAGCGGEAAHTAKPDGGGIDTSIEPDGPPPVGAEIWWISKTGSDSNSGKSIDSAFATFRKALRTMAAGDTLYVDDGVYTDSIGAFEGPYSDWTDVEEAKNGLSASRRTRILGYRKHAVVIDGGGEYYPLFIFKGQHIEIGNMVFLHARLDGAGGSSPVEIQESLDIYLHDVGAAYPDPACDNCQAIVVARSSEVLVEGCWAWGFGARYGILLYAGLKNTARRNVVRYDGSVDGEPKAAIALYSEDQSIAENNIAIDYDSGPDDTGDVHAVLFTTSSVSLTPPSFPPGLPRGLKSVAWYGNVAVNTVSTGESVMFFDSLTSVGGTITAVDNVVGNGLAPFKAKENTIGIWVSNDQGTTHAITLSHNTVYNITGNGVRVDAPPRWSAVTFNDNLIGKLIPASSTCFDDVSDDGARITASNNHLFGCGSPTVPRDASLLNADPRLAYLLKVEAGTPGSGTGTGGRDRGANVVKRYVGGVLSDQDLWPFPNEDAIRQDLCAGPDGTSLNGAPINTRGHNATGWCASGKSLTRYVWEQLGQPSPY